MQSHFKEESFRANQEGPKGRVSNELTTLCQILIQI